MVSVSTTRVNLTAGRIAGFRTEKKQGFLWDSDVQGLAVRTSAGSDKKVFVWQAKLAGTTVRITIGDVRNWDIDQARATAREFHVMVDKGIDPREVRREADQALAQRQADKVRDGAMVLDVFRVYIDERKPKWGRSHLAHHEGFIKPGGEKIKRGRRPGQGEFTRPGILYPLMTLPLSELNEEVISAWLKKESARVPTLTAQAYRALKAFMRWCAASKEYNIVDGAICSTAKVRELVPKSRTKEGDCLQREQLRPWFDAVRKSRNPVNAAYLQTLLLIGSRREELAALRWEDIDFQWNSILIHDKVEGERTVPLTPYVSSLLAALPRRNEWVFSTVGRSDHPDPDRRKKGGHITEPRKAHILALGKAGIPHTSLHGLRRSFRTLSEWVEVPVGVVAQIQGHKPSALAEKHYTRRPLDLLRMWHTKIERWILKEAGIKFDPKAQSKKPAAAKKTRLRLIKSKTAA